MEKLLKDLKNGETTSYLVYENEEICDCDWGSVTIDTCHITHTSISNVILVNSDIIGTTFEESSFNEDDISHADICTISSEKVQFNRVIFDVSTIRDCEFSFCEFCECTFEHVAMTYSKFENCVFRNIIINQSSSYLNNFINCKFINCQFRGNFFYSLFINCEFTHEFITDKLLAYNFITPTDSVTSYDDNIFEKELVYNNMFINIEVYKLNHALIKPDMFIFETFIAIHKLLSHSIVVRMEQIEFIRKVSEFFCQKNMIATITIIQAISIIEKIFNETYERPSSIKKSKDKLNQLKNTLFLEYINRINETPALTIDFTKSQPIIYKITYENEPDIELSYIINTALQKMGISSVKAKRISSENGSFIEFMQFIKEAQPMIQLILSFTTGVVIPIVAGKIKKKKEKNSQPLIDNSLNYNGNNIIVINNLNMNLVNLSSNQECSSAIAQALLENSITVQSDFKGYSKDNIRSIEVVVNDEDNI